MLLTCGTFNNEAYTSEYTASKGTHQMMTKNTNWKVCKSSRALFRRNVSASAQCDWKIHEKLKKTHVLSKIRNGDHFTTSQNQRHLSTPVLWSK